jgi:hypothetical protein
MAAQPEAVVHAFEPIPETFCRLKANVTANGFLAQVFRSPSFHPLLIPAGLALPFSRKLTRRMLGRIIKEDGIALSMDVTQWHGYSFEWSPKVRPTCTSLRNFEPDFFDLSKEDISYQPARHYAFWGMGKGKIYTGNKSIGPVKSIFSFRRFFPESLEFKNRFDIVSDQDLQPGRKSITRIKPRNSVLEICRRIYSVIAHDRNKPGIDPILRLSKTAGEPHDRCSECPVT